MACFCYNLYDLMNVTVQHINLVNYKIYCMNRIQFFYDDDLIALQLKINEWLSSFREITIIETNFTSLGVPSTKAGITNTEKYVFYILFSTQEWGNVLSEKNAKEVISNMEQAEGTINEEHSN